MLEALTRIGSLRWIFLEHLGHQIEHFRVDNAAFEIADIEIHSLIAFEHFLRVLALKEVSSSHQHVHHHSHRKDIAFARQFLPSGQRQHLRS